MILSPAKRLDFAGPALDAPATAHRMAEDVRSLSVTARRQTQADLRRLMGISADLAKLNQARFKAFDPDSNEGMQAAFAFAGDVYQGFDAASLPAKAIDYAQEHVRILSGLYGLLRPLDLMQPYRLEMGTKLANARGKDLYAFWGERISQWLNEDLAAQGDQVLLNLASQEYFGAVKPKALNARIIDTVFKDQKNGQYKIISFYAKKARGLMARYVIKERLQDPEGLKDFNLDGYRFDPASSSENQLVFLRDEQA